MSLHKFCSVLPRMAKGITFAGTTGHLAYSHTSDQYGTFNNPKDLLTLPVSVGVGALKYAVGAPLPMIENDARRKELQELHKDASVMDKISIFYAVNPVLDSKSIPLHEAPFDAIAKDVMHTSQMNFTDPMSKKISDYRTQVQYQDKIARAFQETGEPEGAFLHDIYKNGMAMKLSLAERVEDHLQRTNISDMNLNG